MTLKTIILRQKKTPSRARRSSKLGADSFAGATMIIVGTIMYGIYGILSRLSMLGKKSTLYQSAAAMVMAEAGKFIVSFVLLLKTEKSIKLAFNSITNVPIYEWFLFALPAGLYSVTNNLDFYILKYMDPGSMQILIQTKILSTSILWWYWFKKSIEKQQWIALFLLCLGSMFVAFPKKDSNHDNNHNINNNNNMLHSNDDNNNNNATNDQSMYVEWPMGPIFVLIQICLSAIAGIYTEWVYKKFGRQRSIHLDNLSMYFWGTLSNFFQYFYMNRDKDPNKYHLLYGFNYWTWLLIAVYIVKGLAIAQIMKYFSNIVKLFMTGASIVVSGCLTWMVFGLTWTLPYICGLCLVTIAVLLYKTPKKVC